MLIRELNLMSEDDKKPIAVVSVRSTEISIKIRHYVLMKNNNTQYVESIISIYYTNPSFTKYNVRYFSPWYGYDYVSCDNMCDEYLKNILEIKETIPLHKVFYYDKNTKNIEEILWMFLMNQNMIMVKYNEECNHG